MYPGIGSGYSKQNFHVFYNSMLVSNADYIGFQDLGDGWAKDMHKVFYMGRLVPGADAFFFKVLPYGYAKDNNHVYQYGQIVPDADTFNFQPFSNMGMVVNPMIPQSISTPSVIHHHHHPSPVPSYTSSTCQAPPIPVHISTIHVPPMIPTMNVPPPIPMMPTTTVSGHVIVPGGQYNRMNDSTDCCILI